MEEEVQYASVVFKNKNKPTPQTANKEDIQTIYSELAIKPYSDTSAPAPNNNTVVGKKPEPVRAQTVLIVCLCVLLLGSIAALIYFAVSLTTRSSENQRLSSQMSVLRSSTELLTQENVRLKGQTAELQNLTHNLSRQRDQLNWTVQVIMRFSQFPVSNFCPQKQCRQCLDGWIRFENSCYLFYEQETWKTWRWSQSYCKDQNPISDLVVINSLQEQEFIHGQIKYYYDQFHGYWIGLSQQDNRWVWVDGQTDSLGFWMKKDLGNSGPKALVIPEQNLTTSWDPAWSGMFNKFICESRALTID
uniref:C-type lectin domain-containing protein n=1 Tax=Neogobius melanostomus TaxID=47308 RepID=A0A8C6SQR3_9GOBI